MRELPKQILVDGGHVERSPARQLAVLRDLIDLRATLHAAEVEVPTDLSTAIDAMAPTLRLFQHGDGGLALFNGSSEEEDLRIDMVLQRADGRGRPRMSAPQSGFQRMQAGRALVIVDSGTPPSPGFDRRAHAGTLSFEMSVGRERFIVNCGAEAYHPEINRLLCGTAAHSTLTASDTNSSAISPAGGLISRPETVRCRREEGDGNVWLDLSHDGYRPNYGLLYHRRLFLAASGEDLRGEERLDVFAESGTWPEGEFVLRFHLHPHASMRSACIDVFRCVFSSLSQWLSRLLMQLASGHAQLGLRYPPLLGVPHALSPASACIHALSMHRHA